MCKNNRLLFLGVSTLMIYGFCYGMERERPMRPMEETEKPMEFRSTTSIGRKAEIEATNVIKRVAEKTPEARTQEIQEHIQSENNTRNQAIETINAEKQHQSDSVIYKIKSKVQNIFGTDPLTKATQQHDAATIKLQVFMNALPESHPWKALPEGQALASGRPLEVSKKLALEPIAPPRPPKPTEQPPARPPKPNITPVQPTKHVAPSETPPPVPSKAPKPITKEPAKLETEYKTQVSIENVKDPDVLAKKIQKTLGSVSAHEKELSTTIKTEMLKAINNATKQRLSEEQRYNNMLAAVRKVVEKTADERWLELKDLKNVAPQVTEGLNKAAKNFKGKNPSPEELATLTATEVAKALAKAVTTSQEKAQAELKAKAKATAKAKAKPTGARNLPATPIKKTPAK